MFKFTLIMMVVFLMAFTAYGAPVQVKQTKLDLEIKDMAHLEWILLQVQNASKQVNDKGESTFPKNALPALDVATRSYNQLSNALGDVRTAGRLGISNHKALKEFERLLPLVKNSVSDLLDNIGFKP